MNSLDEYEYQKYIQYEKDNKFDFVLRIYSGSVPYDKESAIKINIFSRDLISLDEYEILIKEKKYTINSSDFLNKLKTLLQII